MKYLLTYLFIILAFYSKAQNLVPNYSFENYSACPLTAGGQVTLAIPWGSATSTCSTDYFDYCSSSIFTQAPRTGSGYTGLYFYGMSDTREYLQVKLDSFLKVNKCYYVEFYVSLSEYMTEAVNNIGANLSIIQPFGILPNLQSLPAHILNIGNPIINDSINWVKVSSYYTALGGEQYLTIGNFFNNINTSVIGVNPTNGQSYYYIDDITVEEVKSQQWHYRDTSMCKDEHIILKAHSTDTINAYTLNWLPTSGLSCINCNSPIAQPQSTTTYTLTKQRCNLTTTDTVRVTVKDCNPISEIPNVFTPNGDGINDTFNFNIVGASDVSFTIYNRWGLSLTPALSEGEGVVPSQRVVRWDGHTTSGEACSEGVYFYTLSYKLANGDVITKKGFITLMR